MTDFETHPIGTAKRIEGLEAKLATASHNAGVFGHEVVELEAKLRKAVGALGDIGNGEPEWPDDPQKELDWCRNRANKTLTELKGQCDE